MKANELMFGDWVLCEGQPTPSNVTIQTIAEDGVWFIGDKFEGAASYDRIFPIPITPDILEKNGFQCKGVWMIEGEDIGVKQCANEWALLPYYADYNGLPFCNIKYVHELQHSLRLCGIDKEITI